MADIFSILSTAYTTAPMPSAASSAKYVPVDPALYEGTWKGAYSTGEKTIISGVLPVDRNGYLLDSVAIFAGGVRDFDGGTMVGTSSPILKNGEDIPFMIVINRDLGGQRITAVSLRQNYIDSPPEDASEFSAAIAVRPSTPPQPGGPPR